MSKTRKILLVALVAAIGSIQVQTAQAQNWGRIVQGVVTAAQQPQPAQQRTYYYPQPQPQPVVGQPVVVQPSYPPNQVWPPYNPVVIDTGKRLDGVTYDPFTGRVQVSTTQDKVRDSYFDQNRNSIDPGSYRYVNRIERDAQGNQWRVTGYQWTTNGKPHGNLSRTRISRTGIPGVDHKDTENVAYSVNPQATTQRQPQSVQKPQQQPRQQTVQPQYQQQGSGVYSPF